MDTLILCDELGLRPLGYSLVKVNDLCQWAEAENLTYDFFKIFSGYPPGNWQFVQAESLFQLMGSWCTHHLIGHRAQTESGKTTMEEILGIEMEPFPVFDDPALAKKWRDCGLWKESLVADDPALAKWWIQAQSQSAFELLFYEAVRDKKIRLLNTRTRLPLAELPSAAQARFNDLASSRSPADARKSGETRGLPKRDILAATWPLPGGRNLEGFLSDCPEWIKSARVSRGAPGRGSSTWNPATLAFCMAASSKGKTWQANKRALDNVIAKHFPEWDAEWQDIAENL